jgi:heme/copper-type cytochrome/quinol oxidase subunit 2
MLFCYFARPKEGIMSENKSNTHSVLFTKENYTLMIVGAVIVALGMFLMSGGKNQDPNTFDYKVVYSTTRITIAPIVIVLGLLVEIYAIFKKPKQQEPKSF